MEDSNLNTEKSYALAMLIECIKPNLQLIDWAYVDQVVPALLTQTIRQETLAILNPSHPQFANDLLRQQAVALNNLRSLYQSLVKCGQLKHELSRYNNHQVKIKSFFV